MKKIIFVLAIVLVFAGCKKENSIEDRISNSMKEYVKKNFDDPKTLVEITEIEKTDVINIGEVLEEAVKSSAATDSIYNNSIVDLTNKMKSIMDSIGQVSSRLTGEIRREQLALLFLDLAGWFGEGEQMDLIKNERNVYYNGIKSTLMNDTLYPISLYNVKVRVKENGDLKLKTYYTWVCDTTQVIKITNEPIKTEAFEKEMDLMAKGEKVLAYDLKLNEYLKRGESIYEKINAILKD